MIGSYAFSDCDALTTIVLNSEVRIGKSAFQTCSKLKNITLTEGIQVIGESAFYHCNSLVSINIPGSIETIESYAFQYCETLRSVNLAEGLERIGSYAFASCNRLESINIPDSIVNIGEGAFGANSYEGGCYSLTSVTLSSSLEQIPDYCFYKSGIEELRIPEGITQIGSIAFGENSSMTAVYLPLTMEEISGGAFSGCSSLTDVYYAGTQAQAEGILIGTNNNYLSSAIWHCAPTHSWCTTYTWQQDNTEVTATRTCSLHEGETESETVHAEAKVTKSPTQSDIGEYSFISSEFVNPAFEVQIKVIKVIPALKDMNVLRLPQSISVIETEAFSGLNCEAVIVPVGCTTIQSGAFSECDNLQYIFIPNTVVEMANDAFENSPDVIIDKEQ